MERIGDILKTLRLEKKLTQEELSNELNRIYNINLNKGMISKWESNKSEPIFKYVKLFSNYYNVSVDYLLGITNLNHNTFAINLTKEENSLLLNFNKLNDIGKNEANKRVSELTEIAKYSLDSAKYEVTATLDMVAEESASYTIESKNKKDIWEEEGKEYLMPIAAHAKEGNFTDEEYQHDMDLMMDDNLWK